MTAGVRPWLCLILGHVLFHKQERCGWDKPQPFWVGTVGTLAIIYSCAWKYFYYWSQKPRFPLSLKAQAANQWCFGNPFPAFFPQLGSVWSIPVLASTGLYLSLLNSTLGCAERWCESSLLIQIVTWESCRISTFSLACFTLSE